MTATAENSVSYKYGVMKGSKIVTAFYDKLG
jgi:hypothetical protein